MGGSERRCVAREPCWRRKGKQTALQARINNEELNKEIKAKDKEISAKTDLINNLNSDFARLDSVIKALKHTDNVKGRRDNSGIIQQKNNSIAVLKTN